MQKKKAAGQPKSQNHEMWSAISQGDLGLKAGFWTGKEGDTLTFRSIVGWVSVVSQDVPSEVPPKNGFFPVVLADYMLPTGAMFLPNYVGVFLKNMSDKEAKIASASWTGGAPQPNVTGTGLA
jgi:hypothetical protein